MTQINNTNINIEEEIKAKYNKYTKIINDAKKSLATSKSKDKDTISDLIKLNEMLFKDMLSLEYDMTINNESAITSKFIMSVVVALAKKNNLEIITIEELNDIVSKIDPELNVEELIKSSK
jgi:hypothetical protein